MAQAGHVAMNGHPVDWRSDPRLPKLPRRWFATAHGTDPFPDASQGPIHKPKGYRPHVELADEVAQELCKDLPGSLGAMGRYQRHELQLRSFRNLARQLFYHVLSCFPGHMVGDGRETDSRNAIRKPVLGPIPMVLPCCSTRVDDFKLDVK